MPRGSLFDDVVSIDVDGVWYVARTTPIVYDQVDPDEAHLILGYNLGGLYPDRTAEQGGSIARQPVDDAALSDASVAQYVTRFAFRAPSTAGGVDGAILIDFAGSADAAGAGGQPFTDAVLSRAVLALQLAPWAAVYRIPLRELVSFGGAFGAWVRPDSLEVSQAVWDTVSTATAMRAAIVDPDSVSIDVGGLAYRTGDDIPANPGSPTVFFPSPHLPIGPTAGPFWVDVVAGGERSGPMVDIISWQSEEIWQQGSNFRFITTAARGSDPIEELAEVYAYTMVGGRPTLIGAGIVETIGETPSQTETALQVAGTGFERELLDQDAPVLAFRDTFHAAAVEDLSALLPDGWSLSSDPEAYDTLVSGQIGGSTLLDALHALAALSGTLLQFSFGRSLHLRRYYAPLAIVATETGGAGGQISSLTTHRDGRQLVTAVEPYASDLQPRLADATETAPDGFYVDVNANLVVYDTAAAKWGMRRQKIVFDALGTFDEEMEFDAAGLANRLLSLAVIRLTLYGQPIRTHRATISRPEQLIRPFSLLTARYRNAVAGDFRVGGASVQYDRNTGLSQTVTLSEMDPPELYDDMSLLARRMRELRHAVDRATAQQTATYTGEITTPHTGDASDPGGALLFLADLGEEVNVTVSLSNPIEDTTLSLAIDGGLGEAVTVGEKAGLSHRLGYSGLHSIRATADPVPARPLRVSAIVQVLPA